MFFLYVIVALNCWPWNITTKEKLHLWRFESNSFNHFVLSYEGFVVVVCLLHKRTNNATKKNRPTIPQLDYVLYFLVLSFDPVVWARRAAALGLGSTDSSSAFTDRARVKKEKGWEVLNKVLLLISIILPSNQIKNQKNSDENDAWVIISSSPSLCRWKDFQRRGSAATQAILQGWWGIKEERTRLLF